MDSYTEPQQTTFDSVEQSAMDIMEVQSPSVLTKTGSVVRELVVRPIAYLLSWGYDNLTNDRTQYSVSYLKTSQLTENEIADEVASNYFVTRKGGEKSKGVITMTITSPSLRIAGGSLFTVGDVSVCTPKQYMVTNGDVTNVTDDDVEYLKAVAYGDNYIVNVPVEAVSEGRIEVAPGTEVTVGFACGVLVEADLTSAITGGTDTETDAELMVRAEYNTAESGIGTYYGLKKKLNKAPVTVYGLSAVSGEDLPAYRSRFNSVNISPGGFVDCYVKTANQAMTMFVDITATRTGTQCSGSICDSTCAGLFSVDYLIVDGTYIDEFSVEYKSNSAYNSDEGARLSCEQEAVITFSTSSTASTLPVRCSVSYLPSISVLQDYMNKDEERFIGQNIQIKAAVPVAVSIACAVYSSTTLTEDELNTLKQTIVDYVNSTEVGSKSLNFSLIRKACAQAVPKADLRLPCTMSCSVFLKDGSRDSFYSTTGILDISDAANLAYWNYQMCFFSTCLDNVRLETI